MASPPESARDAFRQPRSENSITSTHIVDFGARPCRRRSRESVAPKRTGSALRRVGLGRSCQDRLTFAGVKFAICFKRIGHHSARSGQVRGQRSANVITLNAEYLRSSGGWGWCCQSNIFGYRVGAVTTP